MRGWKDIPLGEVLTLQRGFDLPHRDRKNGNYPIISSSGLTGYHNSYKVNPPGVVTGRYGTLGEVFYVDKKFWPLNTALYVKDFKGNNSLFASKLLKIVLSANLNAAGAVPGVNRNHLHKMKLKLPPLPIQKKIAAILSAYDELIENNNRRIAILEKMAEEIYREWFVRLRFPGHEKVKVVKGVPDGWEVISAGAFFDVIKGRSYKSEEIEDYQATENHRMFITLKNFKRGGGFRAEAKKYYCGKYSDNQIVSGGSLVFAVTDMTQDRAVIGRIARIPTESITKSTISCDVVKIEPKNIPESFLYAMLRYSSFSESLKEFANGANVLHLKPDLISKQKVIVPPPNLRERFDVFFKPLLLSMDKIYNTLDKLSKSRDLLLPRLISGKLDVEKLDISFPPGMKE